MPKLSIRDIDVKGKRVFVRVDYNLPMNGEAITDDTRLRASLPTLQYTVERGGKLILASHLGRPKGKPSPEHSLRPVAKHLGQVLGKPVAFVADCVGEEAERAAAALREGNVLLLENLRFHPEEEKNDARFARQLATLAQLYVNDAFGTAHRAHASTEGITHYLSPAAAGLLMEREIEYLGKAIERPARPYVVILGGAKVSDKIELLQNLMRFADSVLIGGAMAYTFLRARGADLGRSSIETEKIEQARDLWQFCERRSIDLHLPKDHIVAEKIDATAKAELVVGRDIPSNRVGVDIGPATRAEYAQEIARAKTVVWNGPMGVFEIQQFAAGTLEIARAVAASSAISIVGGGDSAAAVAKASVASKITHISTGGGASLEFLSGMKLPGVEALTDKK